jgi:hypothetical protein
MSATLPAPPTLASPSWWGADSVRHRAATENRTVFVKRIQPFARAYVHPQAAFAAAEAAGQAGLGPQVLSADAAAGELVLEDLTTTHKTGTLYDFLDAGDLDRLAQLRRSVRILAPAVTRRAIVFDELRSVLEHAVANAAALPGDLGWMLRIVGTIEERIDVAGYELEFCHGDGNASNVMVHRDNGELALVDWDVAGLMDPMQDLGTLLGEHAGFDLEGRRLFESYWGAFDAALYARARLYAAVDAVRWALIGAYADAVDPGTFEYSKFSDWQFFRARTWLAPARVDELLRLV